ncbi:MAG: lipid-A-disaccharide synthase [Spirochaetales bacterium]|nr:lipid-A-disaccharide synthase [Spirochaetales bacterium]
MAKAKRTLKVLVVAGEHSGDELGAAVVRALKSEVKLSLCGTGGPALAAAGVELFETVESMAVIGFTEGLRNYFRLKKLAQHLAGEAIRREVDVALLIDYPGFNLYLAGLLHAAGTKVVQVVSPQLWAWRYGRMKQIQKNVDLMLTLFRFEKEMYDRAGVRCTFIGHPLVGSLTRRLKQGEPVKKGRQKIVGLLPGSRRSEIVRLLHPMLQAARLIKKEKNVRFLLPNVNAELSDFIIENLRAYPDLNVEYSWQNSLNVMQASDLLLVASGTATLEAAVLDVPMIILYRVSWLNFLLAGLVVRTKFIGMVNLLAKKQVAPEFLQTEVDPEVISTVALRMLEKRVTDYEDVRFELGRGNPAEKAARAVLEMLDLARAPGKKG